VIFDGFAHQVPDINPTETDEWLDSFDAVIGTSGKARARFLLMKLLSRAIALQVNFPATVSTPYVNTIPADEEPSFPGDEHLEQRIRAYIRWNAAVMVSRANARYAGIGGHLSTYAAAGALYEVGFNHFFHGKDEGPGDQVFFQGHASPGIYARAFVEGRLSESDLENFRFEVGATASRATRTPVSCLTSGSSRPSRWGSGHSVPSTRHASIATSPTGGSSTPPPHGSGASPATASSTSPSRVPG
jgi:pyruvate dehydrogenase E1 component